VAERPVALPPDLPGYIGGAAMGFAEHKPFDPDTCDAMAPRSRARGNAFLGRVPT
jgi:hypothetical protein